MIQVNKKSILLITLALIKQVLFCQTNDYSVLFLRSNAKDIILKNQKESNGYYYTVHFKPGICTRCELMFNTINEKANKNNIIVNYTIYSSNKAEGLDYLNYLKLNNKFSKISLREPIEIFDLNTSDLILPVFIVFDNSGNVVFYKQLLGEINYDEFFLQKNFKTQPTKESLDSYINSFKLNVRDSLKAISEIDIENLTKLDVNDDLKLYKDNIFFINYNEGSINKLNLKNFEIKKYLLTINDCKMELKEISPELMKKLSYAITPKFITFNIDKDKIIINTSITSLKFMDSSKSNLAQNNEPYLFVFDLNLNLLNTKKINLEVKIKDEKISFDHTQLIKINQYYYSPYSKGPLVEGNEIDKNLPNKYNPFKDEFYQFAPLYIILDSNLNFFNTIRNYSSFHKEIKIGYNYINPIIKNYSYNSIIYSDGYSEYLYIVGLEKSEKIKEVKLKRYINNDTILNFRNIDIDSNSLNVNYLTSFDKAFGSTVYDFNLKDSFLFVIQRVNPLGLFASDKYSQYVLQIYINEKLKKEQKIYKFNNTESKFIIEHNQIIEIRKTKDKLKILKYQL